MNLDEVGVVYFIVKPSVGRWLAGMLHLNFWRGAWINSINWSALEGDFRRGFKPLREFWLPEFSKFNSRRGFKGAWEGLSSHQSLEGGLRRDFKGGLRREVSWFSKRASSSFSSPLENQSSSKVQPEFLKGVSSRFFQSFQAVGCL